MVLFSLELEDNVKKKQKKTKAQFKKADVKVLLFETVRIR